MMIRRITAALAVLAVVLTGRAFADQSLFSGNEIFPGVNVSGVTTGATFSGWTYNCPTEGDCQPLFFGGWSPLNSNLTQGLVSGSLNYKGTPGFPKNCVGDGCMNTVQIIGGKWSWNEQNGTVLSGRVLFGMATWPGGSQASLGCGNGVATFSIEIGLGDGPTLEGNFQGCLDDQSAVLPPKIWGKVDVNLWTQQLGPS